MVQYCTTIKFHLQLNHNLNMSGSQKYLQGEMIGEILQKLHKQPKNTTRSKAGHFRKAQNSGYRHIHHYRHWSVQLARAYASPGSSGGIPPYLRFPQDSVRIKIWPLMKPTMESDTSPDTGKVKTITSGLMSHTPK